MRRFRFTRVCWLMVVCVFGCNVFNALADFIVAPDYAATNQPSNGGGSLNVILREQTVYGASEFPAYPIIINDIRWRPDSFNGGPVTATISNLQVNLSTTLNSADHLSSIFSQNSGTNDTVVFSGALNVVSSFTTLSNGTKAFDIDLPLQTSFFYDPSKGNLLIDMRNFTGSSASLYNNVVGDSPDDASRIYNTSNPNATTASTADSGAAVVEIGYVPAFLPPTISSQPTNQSIMAGESATFFITAGGAPPLSYQWFFNDTNSPVEGATSSSLILTNVQPNQGGNYFAEVTNSYGVTLSSNAFLTVVAAPIINSQPTNLSIIAGESANLFATADGAPPLAYQWFFNDANNAVAGATSASLTLPDAQPNQAGYYFVEVSNSYGTTFSSNALLTVTAAPMITSEPVNQTVPLGATATFTVAAVGLAPFSYQWYVNVTNAIAAATNASLVLTNIDFASEGAYSVQVWNSYGLTNSSKAILLVGVVVPNYAATNQPSNGGGSLRVILREQTVYGASEFPPYPIIINDIRWRPDSINGGPITGTISNLQVNLSTTLGSWDHLNSSFSENTGTNDAVVFSGALNVASSFTTLSNGTKAFDIDLPLQNSFVYDPSKGNLLIDIRNFTGCSAQLYNNVVGSRPDDASRQYNTSDPNATTASTVDSGAAVVEIGYAPAPVPPTISSQPTNVFVTVGGAAMFSVTSGPPPLSYQWFFNTNNLLPGATNAFLTLTNLQKNQTGTYSVVVSNAYGSTISTFAVLTVNFPTAIIDMLNTNVMGGNSFDVPVYLLANGNENTLSFSMNFNTQNVSYASIALGTGASDAALLPNTSQAASGEVGVSVQLPAGETFAAGTQEVVRVTFASAILTGTQSVTVPINFTNQPVYRFLYDAQGNKLATNFVNGSVTISPSVLEGDVTPRPTGDQTIDIFDWSQVGRFVAGLDVVSNAAEFQRADSAPKSTSGDGQLKVTDWVQAGRYAAGIDSPAAVGGPTAPVTPTILTGGVRTISVGGGSAVQGLTTTLPVVLQSQGNENAVGFSLNFDPTELKFFSVAKGSAAGSATLNINSNQAAFGDLGIALALPAGNNFASGAQEIARVTFTALTSTTNASVTFADSPVLRAVSDPLANELSGSYTNTAVTINPPPMLSINIGAGNAFLSWPVWAAGFSLQGTGILPPSAWTNVSVPAQTNSSDISVTVPAGNQEGYFRLQHP